MFLHGNSKIDSDGQLVIAGIRATDLVEEYGTPLIVYDEELIRDRMRAYMRPFEASGLAHAVAYASKAFSSIAVCRIAAEEGLWIDVVSAGELHTALAAGIDPAHIVMHGNNKTEEELLYGLRAGIAYFVVDNFYELDLLNELALAERREVDILLRISPGVDAHTHEFITTGKQDSKFGFDLFSGQVEQAVAAAQQKRAMRLRGLHSHIGSQIFDVEGFRVAAERMAETYAQLRDQDGIDLSVLNLGGGLGIRYTREDMVPPIETMVASIIDTVRSSFAARGMNVPILMLEPGRSVIAEAGTTLYRVGSRKDIPGVRTYVAVDGGMTDNPRLALYNAKYEASIANRMTEPDAETVSIAGKCCESGDMLVWDVPLPKARAGDILAVYCTGAYNYSMASNYNRLPRPAVVFVKDGVARLAVRRETWDDLVRLDVAD